MAVGNHYVLKMSGNLLGQTINNIFRFENVVADGTAELLWDLFEAQVIPRILAVTSDSMTYTDVEIEAIESPTDFYTTSFSYPGILGSGEDMPPFTAWAFKLNPNRLDRKGGSKRFAGIREPYQENGVNSGGIQSELDDLAIVLGKRLISGLVAYIPTLYSKRCVKDSETHRCTNFFIEDFTRVTSAVYDAISTQNTRKFGNGI